MSVTCPICGESHDDRSRLVECVDCDQLGVQGCCISAEGVCKLCESDLEDWVLAEIDDEALLGDGDEELDDIDNGGEA